MTAHAETPPPELDFAEDDVTPYEWLGPSRVSEFLDVLLSAPATDFEGAVQDLGQREWSTLVDWRFALAGSSTGSVLFERETLPEDDEATRVYTVRLDSERLGQVQLVPFSGKWVVTRVIADRDLPGENRVLSE